MNLTPPNIKGKSQEEKNDNMKRYLFSLVEQLNWAIETIQKDLDSAKKTASEAVFDDSKTVNFTIGEEKAELTLERVGLITFATITGVITSENVLNQAEAEVEVPECFRPNAAPSILYAVYLETDDGFKQIGSARFNGKNKINVRCDFFGTSIGQKICCQMIFKN